jgi:hypothetical protein
MDFGFTEEQMMIRSIAREFARKEIAPNAEYYDRSSEFPHEIQRKARELGLINVIIPEEYGGSGLSAIEMIIVGEELAWGCSGIAVGGIAINTLAAQPILLAGDSEQKKKYLGILSRGYGSYCVSEPNAGSDVASDCSSGFGCKPEIAYDFLYCCNGGNPSHPKSILFQTSERVLKKLSVGLVQFRRNRRIEGEPPPASLEFI